MPNDPRIIYFTSPYMPCGAFSLVNCLLEMGIKVSTYYRFHEDWIFDGKYHYANAFSRFVSQIPAFTDNERYEFRDDVHVVWGHLLPHNHMYRNKVFMLTRDPRDGLPHEYLWEKKDWEISYMEWLGWPHHETLLRNIDYWVLFHRLWQQHPDLATFRFEDKCKNNKRLMKRVLDFINVEVDEEVMEKALWRSSYKRYCEMKGRTYDPDKKRYDLWRAKDDTLEQQAIEQAAGNIMQHYRYMPVHGMEVQEVDPFPHMALNPYFEDIPYHGSKEPVDVDVNPYLVNTLAFMRFIAKHPTYPPRHVTDTHMWDTLLSNLEIYRRNAMSIGLIPKQMPAPQEVCV